MEEKEIITQQGPQMQMFAQLMEGTLKKLERYCSTARPMLGGEVYLTGEEVCSQLRLSTRTPQEDRKQLSEFQGKYLRPFRNSHRKAVYVSEETQRKLDFVVRKIGEQGASVSGYVEQVLREHLDQYKYDVKRWRKL